MSEQTVKKPEATPEEPQGREANSPEDTIMAIRQEVYMMGANDYEIPALDDIIKSLRNGTLSAEEAVQQAMDIKARKQDYH
ncbi:MAG: hypothetical protein HY974_00925 [Candidatus Kerfeldbacteria bacterium]|nr:hypothetical protein [Candidatus Kerfeldbacteria bacterium]